MMSKTMNKKEDIANWDQLAVNIIKNMVIYNKRLKEYEYDDVISFCNFHYTVNRDKIISVSKSKSHFIALVKNKVKLLVRDYLRAYVPYGRTGVERPKLCSGDVCIDEQNNISLFDTMSNWPGLSLDHKRLIHSALNSLSDKHKNLLIWKYVDSLPPRLLAENYGASESAVYMMLQKAKQAFREQYNKKRSALNKCLVYDI